MLKTDITKQKEALLQKLKSPTKTDLYKRNFTTILVYAE